MRKWIIIGAIGLVAAVGGGIWLYNWVLGATQPPSAPIVAVPLEVAQAASATPQTVATIAPTVDAPAEPTVDNAPIVAPTSLPATQAAPAAPDAGGVLYTLKQDGSEARFIIHEELRGSPKEVVGKTNQVAGEVSIDTANLGATRIGAITVNARALATDDNQRNQAIRNRILQTDQFELITFEPTEVVGLSGAAQVGVDYPFQVKGNLTIVDKTQPVTFDVTVRASAVDRLSGTATAEIQRSDYGILIPSVPFVANVGETVKIEIDFVLAVK